jgi:aminopeptidase N
MLACGTESLDPVVVTEAETYPAGQDMLRDIISTELDVSIATLTATATITLAGSDSAAASFEAQGLTIYDVRNDVGPLEWTHVDGRLDVGVSPSSDPHAMIIDYGFALQSEFNGLLQSGSTLIWPYHCGNLFPCKSDPSDGMTYALNVFDQPVGQSVVFPESIPGEAPSYVLAWAAGDYSEMSVGTTAAGTEVLAWYLPGGEDNATLGTSYLVDAFDYFEKTLGPYAFGNRVGGIAVQWGPGALGGMEHHPYWHVAEGSMGLPDVHVHEAAHGWYGDGIRIACWEDFVLSEGVVSYLTARAIEEVAGPSASDTVWMNYQFRLSNAMLGSSLKIAWPDSCGAVDIIEDKLFSSIPYMKGAFFFRALEQRIGVASLMAVLAHFYAENVGKAAGFQDLLDMIASDTNYDPTTCATEWLRQEPVPTATVCP